jgi:hypothetical protein
MRKKTRAQRDSVKPSPSQPQAASLAAAGALVLVELGAAFPALILSVDAPRRVISQQDGESPSAFAERVAKTLDGLFGKGVALGSATLACNERLDDSAQNARRHLAGALLGAMAKERAGKVCFSAPALGSGRLRHGLSALARGLFDEWRTAGLEVSVDFGDAETKSGTHTAPYAFTARVA